MTDLTSAATTLRDLHVAGKPLVLANSWDAASARLAVAAGFPVVATSSGAVADSLGYRDQQDAPADEMFAAAARIARAVDVPVTVDAEAGYGLGATELVTRLVDAGAVGCNLEDTDYTGAGGLTDSAAQADWLASVRAAAEQAGVPLVLNARVDVFIRVDKQTAPASLLDEAVARARAYLAAGADCVYPIGLKDQDVLRDIVTAVAPAPVNVMTTPDGPAPKALAETGVARVSLGGTLWRVHQQALAQRLAEFAER
jgi:2-methylisocitrate lyase-like PEP mutase family enzyme